VKQFKLETMRLAAVLTDWAQDRYVELVRPGILVVELDLEIAKRTAVEAAAHFLGEQVEIRVYSLSGAASAAPHGTGADTGMRIEKGDSVVNIIIVRLNGLVVENERTLFVGLRVRIYSAAPTSLPRKPTWQPRKCSLRGLPWPKWTPQPSKLSSGTASATTSCIALATALASPVTSSPRIWRSTTDR